MKIKIQSRGFKLTKALYNQVNSKLHLVLSRYGNRIRQAQVTLLDTNGPKGGEDKRCLICIKVNHSKSIVVQETAPDLYDAISNGAHRIKRAVDRHFHRSRRRSRRSQTTYCALIVDNEMGG